MNTANSTGASPPTSSGPTASRRGRCRLRLYVYKAFLPHLQLQRRSGRFFSLQSDTGSIHNTSCLEGRCQYGTFGLHNVRQYTSEVPIYRRLVSQCPTTLDPEKADMFLIPFFFGYMMTLGWQLKSTSYSVPSLAQWKTEHREMMKAAIASKGLLPHLNNGTARKHLVLFTCDSQFVNIDLHPLFRSVTVVHLGDDGFAGSPHRNSYLGQAGVRNSLPNGVVVPYRVSQWMPMGFTAPALAPRRFLLSMNVNLERHRIRRVIANQIMADATRLGMPSGRLLVTSIMMAPQEAADIAISSVFCVCPTGDSKGFTARFYFVLLHGCIPIRVDGWSRNTTLAPSAFPFPNLINWSKIVIDVPPAEIASLMPQILAMPANEIEDKQRYLRSVAHWFLFDDEVNHGHDDAPAALIHTLEQRLSCESRWCRSNDVSTTSLNTRKNRGTRPSNALPQ